MQVQTLTLTRVKNDCEQLEQPQMVVCTNDTYKASDLTHLVAESEIDAPRVALRANAARHVVWLHMSPEDAGRLAHQLIYAAMHTKGVTTEQHVHNGIVANAFRSSDVAGMVNKYLEEPF